MSTTSSLHLAFTEAGKKAEAVFDVLRRGGIAIIPVYAGYGVFGASDGALDGIYAAKRRAPHKLFTLVGNHALHRAAHVIDPALSPLVDRVTGRPGTTGGLDLALGVVAPIRPEHRLISRITPAAMGRCARDGRVNILLNSGAIMDRLAELSLANGLPVFGTSANLSGFGLKGRVADIEPPVREAADLVVDEGDLPGYSSTIIDLTLRTTVRFGHRYEDVRSVANAAFGLGLPAAPGPADQRQPGDMSCASTAATLAT